MKDASCTNTRLASGAEPAAQSEAGRYGSHDCRRYPRPAMSQMDSRPSWTGVNTPEEGVTKFKT
jgi:hypothetical protein